MIEKIIENHEAFAEQAGEVVAESTSMEAKIRKGLERLDREISEAKTAIQTHAGNIIGSYVDDFIYDSLRFRDQIKAWEDQVDAKECFLKRAPAIRDELKRQDSEASGQIKCAEAVKEQLSKLCSYRDKKNHLREYFSEGVFFEFADLVREITAFEADLFTKDFLPFFSELKQKYGKNRVLNIPVPTADDTDFDKFWMWVRYEILRHDMLGRSWSPDTSKGEDFLREMKTIANNIASHGPLAKDYNNEFFTKLQNQNMQYNIKDLR